MKKLVKRNQLRDDEKHNVESPFFAISEVYNGLTGSRFNRLPGMDRFVEEYKDLEKYNHSEQQTKIEKILRNQEWYLVVERPVSPLFPKIFSEAAPTGHDFGPFKSPKALKKTHTTTFTELIEQPLYKDGLTIYLGGAGMNGEYIDDQVKNLLSARIYGAVAGKLTEEIFSDAVAVLKYRYPARSMAGFSDRGPYTVDTDWSLGAMGVTKKLPKNGQFNLIGYSWGSLVAAQSALFYAEKGTTIDNLVLIGSPISKEFLVELRSSPNVKRVLVIDLTTKGDRIFAGMSDADLIQSLPSLFTQMAASQSSASGKGHFFYGTAGAEGDARRRELAERLKNEGLE